MWAWPDVKYLREIVQSRGQILLVRVVILVVPHPLLLYVRVRHEHSNKLMTKHILTSNFASTFNGSVTCPWPLPSFRLLVGWLIDRSVSRSVMISFYIAILSKQNFVISFTNMDVLGLISLLRLHFREISENPERPWAHAPRSLSASKSSIGSKSRHFRRKSTSMAALASYLLGPIQSVILFLFSWRMTIEITRNDSEA